MAASVTTPVSGNNLIQLWDLKDGRCLRSVPYSSSLTPMGVLFTPRESELLLTTTSSVELWNLKRDECMWQLRGQAVALNPTGNHVVIAFGDTICCVCISTGEKSLAFKAEGSIRHLEVTPDGHWLVSAGNDGTVRVWSMDSGDCVAMEAVESGVCALSRISPRGLFAFGTEAGEVLIRQIEGIEIGSLLVTPFRSWTIDENSRWGDRLVVCCPECTYVTTVPDRPASEFPVTVCPRCGANLQSTTFVIDNRLEMGT
jgi:WD40 repeat protein